MESDSEQRQLAAVVTGRYDQTYRKDEATVKDKSIKEGRIIASKTEMREKRPRKDDG